VGKKEGFFGCDLPGKGSAESEERKVFFEHHYQLYFASLV
jgi:hypothetical protein